jgi:hypothetical protein
MSNEKGGCGATDDGRLGGEHDVAFLNSLACKPFDAWKPAETQRLFWMAMSMQERLARSETAAPTPAPMTYAEHMKYIKDDEQAPRSAVEATAPLTEEEVEGWRKKIKAKIFSDFCGEPNEDHGKELQQHFDRLCDMAIRSLARSANERKTPGGCHVCSGEPRSSNCGLANCPYK